MASSKKDLDVLLRRLRAEYGCETSMGKSGHWRVTRPGCQNTLTMSATPSGPNALRYVKADLKRYLGIEL